MVQVNAKCIKYFRDNAQTNSNYKTTQQVDSCDMSLTKGQVYFLGSLIILYFIFVIIFVKFFVNEEKEK